MIPLRSKGTCSLSDERRVRGARRRPGYGRRGTMSPGMTLGELAIILVIVGIVLSMATPYLLRARNDYTMDNAARDVLRGLQRARFEALRRNESVYFARLDATHYRIEGLGDFAIPGGLRFVSGPDTVRFASFGPVLGGASPIVLTDGQRDRTITINLSGYASLE